MVVPFVGANAIKPEVLQGLTAMVVDEARKLPGVTVLDLNAAALSAVGTCVGDPSCLGKGLGRQGANQFVLGTAEKADKGGYQVNLTLHDTPGGAQVASVDVLFKGKGDQLEALARRAITQLVLPDSITGGLQVEVNVTGAEVFVDGKLVGRTPLPRAVGGLREGPHNVRITKDGYTPFEQNVDITFQDVAGVDVRMMRDLKTAPSSAGSSATPAASGPSRPFPFSAVVVPAVGGSVWLVGAGLLLLGAGGLAGGTFWQARSIEDRALKGQLFFPQDMWMVWVWRVLLGATIGALVAAALVTVGVLGATAVATAGLLVLHFTRPLPKEEVVTFSDPSIRGKTVETKPAEVAEEPAAPPPAVDKPVEKPKKKKKADLTEETLPEGE